MVTIRLPTVLRRLADDQATVTVEADTVGDAVARLGEKHPELGRQLLADGKIRPFVRVFVDQDDIASLDGPETPLSGNEQLRIVPGIAGGSR